MKLKAFIAVLFLIVQGFAFAEKLANLPEVMKPWDFFVCGDRLYIGDDNTIHIYSLKDFKQIKQFGRAGAGPGEFFNNKVRVEALPDKLAVNTIGKLIYFSLDGTYISDVRNPFIKDDLHPIGTNYAVSIFEGPDTQRMNLYDKDFKLLQNIYVGSYGKATYWYSEAAKNKIVLVPDYVEMKVHKDRIYIGDTRKGFYFAVCDSNGKQLYEVKKEHQPIKIPESYKQEQIKIQHESPGWETIKNKVEFVFPEYFPAYRSCLFSDDKMYFVTHIVNQGKDEAIVTDLKGDVLGKTYVPSNTWNFTFSKDKLYWLVENDKEEMWELYAEDVNQTIKR